MTQTYYRVHGPAAPAFSAEHAWSGLWGRTFSADGSQAECLDCGGTGEQWGEPCQTCDATGWEDCLEGYSCCATAADLVAYLDDRGSLGEGDEILAFEGEQVGTGFDGEPLVVPTDEVRRLSLAELRQAAAE